MYTLQDAIVTRLGEQLQKRIAPLADSAIKLYCPAEETTLLSLVQGNAAKVFVHNSLEDNSEQSDLTICHALLEEQQADTAQQWLAMQRNLWSKEIALVIDTRYCDWPQQFFIGLGFFRLEEAGTQQLWYYAIDSYNRKRQWNNNRYWANPQNFEKYRW
jgi:hypothetical protein